MSKANQEARRMMAEAKQRVANRHAQQESKNIKIMKAYLHPNNFNWAVVFNDGSTVFSDHDETDERAIQELNATPEQKQALIDEEIWLWGFEPMPKDMIDEMTAMGFDAP